MVEKIVQNLWKKLGIKWANNCEKNREKIVEILQKKLSKYCAKN